VIVNLIVETDKLLTKHTLNVHTLIEPIIHRSAYKMASHAKMADCAKT